MIAQYTLHNIIGNGGYSTVYKCTDSIGVRYACKMMPKEKNKRDRVENEMSIMKSMKNSPKIVRFVDIGEDDENFYIIQEWCRGGSVKDYIESYTEYGENTVASIVRGVLRGLHHLHENGIIHRDIKAGNIYLGDKSDDADVKIGDFGTSLYINDDVIEVDSVIGTPWFMAPENLKSEYHRKSDIWSLGVLTYQLLSGKLPFNDKKDPNNPSLSAVWKSILYDELKMEGKRWVDIDIDAKDFVSLCLQKEYNKRPTAYECLQHPFLTKTDCNDRFKGTSLKCRPFEYINNIDMRAVTLDVYYDL
jgi:calcium-dependent protein kinase